jgi:hypothetical protein
MEDSSIASTKISLSADEKNTLMNSEQSWMIKDDRLFNLYFKHVFESQQYKFPDIDIYTEYPLDFMNGVEMFKESKK